LVIADVFRCVRGLFTAPPTIMLFPNTCCSLRGLRIALRRAMNFTRPTESVNPSASLNVQEVKAGVNLRFGGVQ
jgi:hypothetical protein